MENVLTATITVKEVAEKLTNGGKKYFYAKDDKRCWNSWVKLELGKTYDVSYSEVENSHGSKSKWVSKAVEHGQAINSATNILGGTSTQVKVTTTATNKTPVDPALWENAVQIVSGFISGKKGEYNAQEIGVMISKCYNELLNVRKGL